MIKVYFSKIHQSQVWQKHYFALTYCTGVNANFRVILNVAWKLLYEKLTTGNICLHIKRQLFLRIFVTKYSFFKNYIDV